VELKKKIIEVKYEGKVYELRRCPTQRAKLLFQEMKKIDHEKEADKLIELQENLLKDCGATDDLLKELDFEQFGMIANEVMGIKKN